MKKTWVRLSIAFLLTFIFLFFFFRRVDWKEVFGYLTDINLVFLILIILLVPMHFITRAIRWDYLLKHEKKGVKFSNRFNATVVGFTVVYVFPGRVGEIVRPLYLAQKENMKKGFVFGTIVVERTFDIFSNCFLLGVFLIAKPLYSSYFQAQEETYSNLQMWGFIGVILASVLLALFLALYFFKEKTLSFFSFFLKPLPERTSQRILKFIEEFILGLKFFHSVGNLLIYLMLSLVVWIAHIFYYWLLFFAYDISLPFFFLIPYVFLSMIGASIPTPGMAGGFHYFSKLAMTTLFGIDANLAVGMTIVVHAIQLVVTCLMGYVILWKEGISLLQIRKISEDIGK